MVGIWAAVHHVGSNREVSMTKRAVLPAMVLAGFLTAGCSARLAVYGRYSAPPPPRVEVYGVAPGPGFVWVGGYWRWVRNDYAWTPGRWERPPRRGAVWVPGHWEQRRNGYRWREGRWR